MSDNSQDKQRIINCYNTEGKCRIKWSQFCGLRRASLEYGNDDRRYNDSDKVVNFV